MVILQEKSMETDAIEDRFCTAAGQAFSDYVSVSQACEFQMHITCFSAAISLQAKHMEKFGKTIDYVPWPATTYKYVLIDWSSSSAHLLKKAVRIILP